MKKTNIFTKILAILGLLLIPIVALYTYSSQVSVQVVQGEIEQNNHGRLSFLAQQIDDQFDQYVDAANSLSVDPQIKPFMGMEPGQDDYAVFRSKLAVQDYLELRGKTGGWEHAYSLYAPRSGEAVSTHNSIFYQDLFRDAVTKQELVPFVWQYEPSSRRNVSSAFYYRTVEPLSAYDRIGEAELVGEVRIGAGEIGNMLTAFKSDSSGDPFLYQRGFEPIASRTANSDRIRQVIPFFEERSDPGDQGTFTISLQDEEYMVNYVKSAAVGWYLIEYVPLESILQPIRSSRDFFWISMGIIFAVAVLAAYLMYRNVQVPIRELYMAAKKLRMGDYSVRVAKRQRDEFGYLFEQFNLMSAQIEDLIERVYAEKLRSRDATLKQLQSQINPHFLYNCLFFMKNMTKIGEHDAVMAMSVKLGEYYRYTTRVDQQETTLREEMKLIDNYLSIQNMRMDRIRFDISIPEEMMELAIPRLLLQPIVENAIIHGIEPRAGEGRISVTGKWTVDGFVIVVEDNGVGLSEGQLEEVYRRINRPEPEGEDGCGLRNVHLRLKIRYGSDSGLRLERSAAGGIVATVVCKLERQAEAE